MCKVHEIKQIIGTGESKQAYRSKIIFFTFYIHNHKGSECRIMCMSNQCIRSVVMGGEAEKMERQVQRLNRVIGVQG